MGNDSLMTGWMVPATGRMAGHGPWPEGHPPGDQAGRTPRRTVRAEAHPRGGGSGAADAGRIPTHSIWASELQRGACV